MFLNDIGFIHDFMLAHLNLYLPLLLPLFHIHSQPLLHLHLLHHRLLLRLFPVGLIEQTLNLADGPIVELQVEVVIGFTFLDTLYISQLVVEIDGLKRTHDDSLIGTLQRLQINLIDAHQLLPIP